MTDPVAQYPYQTLQSVGTKLTGIQQNIQKGKSAYNVNGLGSDQGDIVSTLGDFAGEWEQSARKIIENIGDSGKVTTQVAGMAQQTDDGLAKGLKGDKT
ncbi:hypothetical protein [Nakamurella aerolata]|uniref:Uncharacterized protein n=1 Tax=Nakamurella aerolata TaxID=1656892 RepID=A0A849A8H6_9ACTN|nr:hypothetical protein [Nakamurella aerolata]NNG36307.1 hypothetical protein [Nakamurella aerolata]